MLCRRYNVFNMCTFSSQFSAVELSKSLNCRSRRFMFHTSRNYLSSRVTSNILLSEITKRECANLLYLEREVLEKQYEIFKSNRRKIILLICLHKQVIFINRPYLERVASLSVYRCFPGGPSDQILDHFWSSFRCRRKTRVPGEKLAEASLDWKPNAHKCRDRGSNPGLIGAMRGKIRCANLLPHDIKFDRNGISFQFNHMTSLQ